MPISYSILKSELSTDPASMGYSGKSPQAQVSLLNAATQPYNYTTLPKDEIVWGLAPYIAQLMADIASGVTKALKYAPLLQQFNLLTNVDLTNAFLQSQFASLIADGYLTTAELNAVITRAGSRAEILLGSGTVLTVDDVLTAERQ